jgi:UDP-N-acetylmuramoyl-L-alanyl-D-glutamate--2,6-diaminopimelate ligase
MMLKEMLKGCDYNERFTNDAFMNTDISGVAYDSRNVEDGYLFVAIKGEKYDGHKFIEEAIGKGAVAAVVEKASDETGGRCLLVKDARKALACISNNFYGRPSEDLAVIGITGTNGKTTTSYMLKSVLESWGKDVGLIGTIQYMIKDRPYPAPHTTPESLEFQSFLRQMLLSGCTHAVTEVSSHALAQCRVDGAVFQTAVFTNLTRDHLDFHTTMEDYFRTKERLFQELLDKRGTAIINIDDPYGKRLDAELRSSRPSLTILTYGLKAEADITARDIEVSFQGLRFTMSFEGKRYNISSQLTGMPNVYNIMSAVGAAVSLGVPGQVILEGIKNPAGIAGRFEKIDAGQQFLCIIDYAHTEDALERLICTAREIIRQSSVVSSQSLQEVSPRIITVFGCGGDRDRGKRPGMGAVATGLSDYVIVTSDNPRSEDPSNIIKDVVGGIRAGNYLIEPDRREAITKAVEMAGDGDIVLIAGKGHEDYQEIKGVKYPFSDRDVVKEAIRIKLRKPE